MCLGQGVLAVVQVTNRLLHVAKLRLQLGEVLEPFLTLVLQLRDRRSRPVLAGNAEPAAVALVQGLLEAEVRSGHHDA